MPSYKKPKSLFRICKMCGSPTRMVDSRPHSCGSISRLRRCPQCKYQVRSFEVTPEDYYKLYPEAVPMKKIQTPPKKKYVRKTKKGKPIPPPKPKPEPVTLASDWKMPQAALDLLARTKNL